MSLSLFPPSRNGSNLNLRRGYAARRSRGERAIMLAAIESLEPRQLLAATPAPAVNFSSAEVISLADATYVNTGAAAASDRSFSNIFVTDLTGTDQKNGTTYSKPSKPLDIVFLGRDGLTVLLGNGNGTFKPAVVYPVAPLNDPTGVVYSGIYGGTEMPGGFLSLDGDGFPDFVVVESEAQNANSTTISETPGSVTVFLGNGNGTFKTEDYSNDVGVNPDAVTAADLHISGVKNEEDIALANIGNGTVTILTGNGKGQFGTNGVLAANEPAALPVRNEPESIIAADVNGDGVPDLLVGNVDGGTDETISVLVNKSSNKGAVFEPQFVLSGYGDGVLLEKLSSNVASIVTNDADILTPNLPLANPNVPSFTKTVALSAVSYGATDVQAMDVFTAAQFPGRSRYQQDVVSTDYEYSTVSIARGDGTLGFLASDQTYSTVVAYTPASTATATQTGTATASVTQSTYLLGYGPVASATGDMTGDGYPDVVIADYGFRGNSNGVVADISRAPAITILMGDSKGTFSGEKQPGIELGVALDSGSGYATDPVGQTISSDFGDGSVDAPGYPTAGSVVGTNAFPDQIAVADLTGDGLNDIITLGEGTAPTTTSPAAAYGGNFKFSNLPGVINVLANNQDGVAGAFGPAPEAIHYSGTTSFIGVSTIVDFYDPVAVATADLSGDGVDDLIVLNKVDDNLSTGLGESQFEVQLPAGTDGSLTFTVSDSAGTFTTGSIPYNATIPMVQTALTSAGVKGVSVSSFQQVGVGAIPGKYEISFSPTDGAVTLAANTSVASNADLVFVSPSTGGTNAYYTGEVVVYQGDGDGTFNPTPISITQVGFDPVSLAVLPVGDGAPDLVVANYGVPYKGDKTHFGQSGSIEVLDNNGDGTFTVGDVIPDAYGPAAVTVGTFGNTVSNTSVYDLAVVNTLDVNHEEGGNDGAGFADAEEAGTLNIYLGDGAGNFTESQQIAVGSQPNDVVVGNFNGPSQPLGLAVLNQGEESLSLLHGNGDGTFNVQQVYDFPYLPDEGTPLKPRETDSAPVSIAPGDINGDGYTDIVVTYAGTNNFPGYSDTNPGGKVGVMLNLGAASPDGLGDLAAPVQILTADTQLEEEPFTNPIPDKAVASVPDSVAVADVTGDGKNDLIILNGNGGKYTGTLNILLNNSASVNSKPQFNTSTVTFAVGTTGSQTVTTTGYPAPTLSDNGATLPAGLTITFSTTNGSATISGTPIAVGDSTITLTATNSVGTTSETLAIDVVPSSQAAQIVSEGGNPVTFTEGQTQTATFVAENFSGSPIISIASGTLPAGLTFAYSGDTAVIEGTPDTGDSDDSPYDLTLSATDGISQASLPLVIDVNSGQAFTSANNDTFTVGTNGSFQVSTNIGGSPTYTISGTLPAGVTFNASTGLLSGTPTEITNGDYTFPLTIGIAGNNSITPQSFVLTVDESPEFTSGDSATFLTNTAGSFPITTVANPTASNLTESGQLPAGLSFVNNLDGTAAISGTPASGISGVFDVVLTASNGIGTAATETLAISVSNSAPSITVANGTLTLVNTPLTDTINFNVVGGQLQVSYEGATLSYQLGTITDIMVRLGAGNDSLSIGAGVPAVFAKCQTGQDTIVASNDAADTLIGGSGSDSINVSGTGADSLIGRAGSDTLIANGGNSTLKAGSGPSSLSGGNGNDLLIGNGSATLIAGSGNSTLIAGNGDSSLSGGSGQDSILGGRGDDTLVGGTGNSTLIAGSGSDNIYGGSGNSMILLEGPGGSTISAGSGNDTITAESGNVSVLGGGGSSLIQGGAGNDTLIAGGPGSTLLGGAGNDSISGAGGDELGGGTGSDTIAAFPTDTILGSPTDLIIL